MLLKTRYDNENIIIEFMETVAEELEIKTVRRGQSKINDSFDFLNFKK